MEDLLNTEIGKNDYDWLLTPPGTPRVPALDAAEKAPSSTVTKHTITRSSSTTRASRTFDKIWVAFVVHLYFPIASDLLLPRDEQLEPQIQAIPSQMVTDTSQIMAAAMGTSLEILVVLFHITVGAQLVPLIGKPLRQKMFCVNWIYMPIQDMRRWC
ncbi:proline-rich family protein [Zea mays]|uniref:Proline-rich family protein n=1 Tax=Zea mays TaxID=4577 RepID=A0A1D6N8C8_MAIZE|nr:proline-rich family protein [Zea mays]